MLFDLLRTKTSELDSRDSWASVGGDSVNSSRLLILNAGADYNFTKIAMMRLSAKLKKAGTPIPVQRLTALPTLQSQAEWLARQD